MELRDYLKLLSKYWVVFILIIIASVASAYVFSKRNPLTYTGSTTLTITKSSNLKQSQVNYYLYDNFYNIQSANLVTKTVSAWLSTPAFVKAVYENAGLAIENISNSELSGAFNVTPVEPASLIVTKVDTNQDDLLKVMNGLVVVAQKEADKLNMNGEATYSVVAVKPAIAENNPRIMLNLIIGLASGIILGLIAIISIAYIKNEKI